MGSNNSIIPDSVVSINDYAFMGRVLLKQIIIPKNVYNIGEAAFASCSNLESIILPNGLKTIKDGAFYGCKSLKEIDLPDEIEVIGSKEEWFRDHEYCPDTYGSSYCPGGVFEECTDLNTITLPNDIKIFDWYSFWKCNNIENIAIKCREPEKVNEKIKRIFSILSDLNNTKKTILTVPIGTGYAYRHDSFFTIFKGINANLDY